VSESGLVADIGGTHARFATVALGTKHVSHIRQFNVRDFSSLEEALSQYRSTTPDLPPDLRQAAIAVATRLDGDRVHITNNPWTFSLASLRNSHGFERMLVLNDLAAVGYAVPSLDASEVRVIGEKRLARPLDDGAYAVVGVGTGLGVCGMLVQSGTSRVLASEGGHIGFAPFDGASVQVLKYLAKTHGRVSAERVLSGQGLEGIHAALEMRDGRPASGLEAETITARAREGSDASCVETVDVFCRCLGAFAGDTVLMFGAWRGLMLSGSMLQHIDAERLERHVRAAFEAKGRFADDLQAVPMELIVRRNTELIGAATLLNAETAGSARTAAS
jgi:glucokinase